MSDVAWIALQHLCGWSLLTLVAVSAFVMLVRADRADREDDR